MDKTQSHLIISVGRTTGVHNLEVRLRGDKLAQPITRNKRWPLQILKDDFGLCSTTANWRRISPSSFLGRHSRHPLKVEWESEINTREISHPTLVSLVSGSRPSST